ncbi:helix-turn-helix domain-containing protein [Mycobacterium sp. BMJ-28]
MRNESLDEPGVDGVATVGLGAYLREIRRALGMTLRAVEAATDRAVSNGYLSQIESGVVERPSAHVLFHLANVYGIKYEDLMARAGNRLPASSEATVARQMVAGVPLRALEELDEQDQQLLREYLAFLQSRKKHRT